MVRMCATASSTWFELFLEFFNFLRLSLDGFLEFSENRRVLVIVGFGLGGHGPYVWQAVGKGKATDQGESDKDFSNCNHTEMVVVFV